MLNCTNQRAHMCVFEAVLNYTSQRDLEKAMSFDVFVMLCAIHLKLFNAVITLQLPYSPKYCEVPLTLYSIITPFDTFEISCI